MTYNVTYQHNIYTLNIKEDEFFMCGKFGFSSIMPKLQPIRHFPKVKLLNPGLKLLELF